MIQLARRRLSVVVLFTAIALTPATALFAQPDEASPGWFSGLLSWLGDIPRAIAVRGSSENEALPYLDPHGLSPMPQPDPEETASQNSPDGEGDAFPILDPDG